MTWISMWGFPISIIADSKTSEIFYKKDVKKKVLIVNL